MNRFSKTIRKIFRCGQFLIQGHCCRDCFRCGKVCKQVVEYQQNTGSIGYIMATMLNACCCCKHCKIWFCGDCSDRTKGFGSMNWEGDRLRLDCPCCQQEARTPVVITNLPWSGKYRSY